MLLNEMYQACGYLKSKFTEFEAMANKIKLEKIFIQGQVPTLEKTHPNIVNNQQFKPDEVLMSMITTTEWVSKFPLLLSYNHFLNNSFFVGLLSHSVEEIDNYITSKNLYYNFVAHVFLHLANMNKDEWESFFVSRGLIY